MSNVYVSVGSWLPSSDPVGFCVFDYAPETGELTNPRTYGSHVRAGAQVYDPKRKILYVVDECEQRAGERGGGGFVLSYRLYPDSGELEFLGEACTILTAPAYLWLDPAGEYLLVACHSKRNCVTKAVHDSKGNWNSCVLYDDAGVVMMRLDANGRLDVVCDIAIHEGLTDNAKQVHAHPHSVVGSPDGSVFYVCDKGLDRIYAYGIDRENDRLIGLAQRTMDRYSAPRYSAFHPTLPVWYENNEDGNLFYTFAYEKESGYLRVLSKIALYEETEKRTSQSDLLVHPNGRYLYAALRGSNKILLMDIDESTGIPTVRKEFLSDSSPRCLAVSPDQRFLFTASPETASVNVYEIEPDGGLKDTGRRYTSPCAANIVFLEE